MILVAVDGSSGNGNGVVCRVDDTGSFTVPASTFAMIPAATTLGFVGVGRVSPMTTTVGVDDGDRAGDELHHVGPGHGHELIRTSRAAARAARP